MNRRKFCEMIVGGWAAIGSPLALVGDEVLTQLSDEGKDILVVDDFIALVMAKYKESKWKDIELSIKTLDNAGGRQGVL